MNPFLFSSIEGNGQCLDGGAMFGNAPRVLWSRWQNPDSEGRIQLSCRSLLIEMGEIKILCETGIGAFFEPKLAERYGVQNKDSHELLKNLSTLGMTEEDIDYVILSHLHFDHAGGLLPAYSEIKKGNTDLCFPKALYIVGKQAFDRACQPHLRDRASFIPGLTDKLKQSGRLIIVETNKPSGILENHLHPSGFEFSDRFSSLPREEQIRRMPILDRFGLSFIFTDGHTPGQMHTIFQNEKGQKIFFAGDLIPGRAWVHLPITMGYDRWPEKLIEEKQAIYQKAEEENWLIFFTHDKETACARIRKNQKGHYESYNEHSFLQRNNLHVL